MSTQDFPSGVEARNKTGAPARAFAQRMTATPDTPNTPEGAQAFKATQMACLLILARPAGTDRYTTEEQLQRAATIASTVPPPSLPSVRTLSRPPLHSR